MGSGYPQRSSKAEEVIPRLFDTRFVTSLTCVFFSALGSSSVTTFCLGSSCKRISNADHNAAMNRRRH